MHSVHVRFAIINAEIVLELCFLYYKKHAYDIVTVCVFVWPAFSCEYLSNQPFFVKLDVNVTIFQASPPLYIKVSYHQQCQNGESTAFVVGRHLCSLSSSFSSGGVVPPAPASLVQVIYLKVVLSSFNCMVCNLLMIWENCFFAFYQMYIYTFSQV
jgi:hypothetical protein